MLNNDYTLEALQELEQRLFNLVFITQKGEELKPTKDQVEKMMLLCKKRNEPSYYKLRHSSGMGDEYTFKDVNMYSNDGKKMRRFESGL
jgi:hypothetical protein